MMVNFGGSINWRRILECWKFLRLGLCVGYMDIHYVSEKCTELYTIKICALYNKLYFNEKVFKKCLLGAKHLDFSIHQYRE